MRDFIKSSSKEFALQMQAYEVKGLALPTVKL